MKFFYNGCEITIEDRPKMGTIRGVVQKNDVFACVERPYRKILHNRHTVDLCIFGDVEKIESWTTDDKNITIAELRNDLTALVDLALILSEYIEEEKELLKETKEKAYKNLGIPDPDKVAPFGATASMLELYLKARYREARRHEREAMIAMEARRDLFREIYDYLDDHTDISAEDLDKVRYRFGREDDKKCKKRS